MSRARQLVDRRNFDSLVMDASAASTDEGEHLLLDSSAATTDVGFFINTEIGTTETPPEGFVGESSLASNAVTNTKVADGTIKAGGFRDLIPYMGKMAMALGVNGIFMEVHHDPDNSKCDAPTQWPLEKLEELLEFLDIPRNK